MIRQIIISVRLSIFITSIALQLTTNAFADDVEMNEHENSITYWEVTNNVGHSAILEIDWQRNSYRRLPTMRSPGRTVAQFGVVKLNGNVITLQPDSGTEVSWVLQKWSRVWGLAPVSRSERPWHQISFLGETEAIQKNPEFSITAEKHKQLAILEPQILTRLPWIKMNNWSIEYNSDEMFSIDHHVLEAILNKKQLETIFLTSNGGAIDNGFAFSGIISRHELNTVAKGVCSSACTLAFLAGVDRHLMQDGRLGFHRSWVPPTNWAKLEANSEDDADQRYLDYTYEADDLLTAVYEKMNFMLDVGIDPEFVIEANLRTSWDSMWYPNLETLFEANVLTSKILNMDAIKNE